MVSTKYYLGELITQRREKNPGGNLPIRGVSKEGLQPPKQIDADTSIYNLYYRNDFVYNPARMELGSIAFNDEYDKAICSSLYEIFYVHRTDLVLPEYLALFVKHSEFARYCNYIGNGSAREYCRFENISDIPIFLPSISEQQKIVHDYRVITDRIELLRKINENLEEQAQTIYKSWFETYDPFGGEMPTDWFETTIGDLSSDVICGKTPPTEDVENYGGNTPFITIPDMHGSVYVVNTERTLSEIGVATQSNKTLPENSICVSCIATVGLVCLTAEPSQTNQQINSIVCKPDVSPYYVYLKMRTMEDHLKALGAGGSATLNVNKTLFSEIKVLYPDKNSIKKFHRLVSPIFTTIKQYQLEMQRLYSLSNLILYNMQRIVS